MVEAERRSPARVLQGLGGESLVMAVDETEIYLDYLHSKHVKRNALNPGDEGTEGKTLT